MGFIGVRTASVKPALREPLGFVGFYGLDMGFVWVKHGFSGKSS